MPILFSTSESKSPEKVKSGSNNNESSYINLSPLELRGLTAIVKWIESLPPTRLSVPDQIINHQQLLYNIKVYYSIDSLVILVIVLFYFNLIIIVF